MATPAPRRDDPTITSPFELPGWVEFHAWRSGLRPHRVDHATPGGRVAAILYLDGRGRVRLPPLASWLPVTFECARQRASSRTAVWLSSVDPLVEEMRRRTVPRQVFLSPTVDDVRPWQWAGFLVGLDYTFQLDLPFDESLLNRNHRSSCEKARRLGLTVERVEDVGAVIECLAESASRIGYRFAITAKDLVEARRLLGDDAFRMYACLDAAGRPASACVVVHSPGAQAFGWLAGTRSAMLADGANHLLWRVAFDDLAGAGATGVEFGGPNSPSLSEFKARWGSRLVPIYSLRSYSLRAAARFVVDWSSHGAPGRIAASWRERRDRPASPATRGHPGAPDRNGPDAAS